MFHACWFGVIVSGVGDNSRQVDIYISHHTEHALGYVCNSIWNFFHLGGERLYGWLVAMQYMLLAKQL